MKVKWSAFICLILLFCLPLTIFAGEELSKGEILEILLYTAPDYTSYIAAEDIVSGYNDGDFRADKLATDIEMLVMLSRAFPSMPMPQGYNNITLPQKANIEQLPDWATKHFTYLNERGIISESLVLDESVTKEELYTYLKRIWRYYGGDIKDDFYAGVNNEVFKTINSAEDYNKGFFSTVTQLNNQRIGKTIMDIAEKQSLNKKEAKIKSIYISALEMQQSNSSLAVLEPYLTKIDNAKNLNELIAATQLCADDLYMNGLFGFSLIVDVKNNDRYIPYFSVYEPTFSYEEFELDIYKQPLIDYITELLTLSGENKVTAQRKAAKVYEFEKELSKHCLHGADIYDTEKNYNLYTLDELQQLYPYVDLTELAKSAGIELKPDDEILIQDVGLIYNFAYACEDVALAKVLAKISILASTGNLLSYDYICASEKFEAEIYGTAMHNYTTEERAMEITKNIMSNYISEIYCTQYFSDNNKQQIIQMTESIIEVYKEKINSLEWMSKATKKKAIEKLDNLTIKVGYDSGEFDYIENADIKASNSLFRNYMEICKAYEMWTKEYQHKAVDKTEWMLSAYDVNACYVPSLNEVILPAGILQAPFYSPEASLEQNMGRIGVVIAHELSHAFDTTGAMFDAKGDYGNWWTEEDYTLFSDKCNEITQFYNNIEFATDIVNNGSLTVGENMADLGGVACALEVLAQQENVDYKLFYSAFAQMWCDINSREMLLYQSTNDPHSAASIRVNRCVVNFQSFYDAFEITPNDGMYVDENERVSLW